MQYTWLTIAILSAGYFITCLAVTGSSSMFNYIWLAISLFFGFVFYISRMEACGRIVLHVWTKTAFTVVMILGLGYLAVLEGLVISKMNAKPDGRCDYMIVLGAHVKGDVVSKSLAQRLDIAYEYACSEDGKECTIIVAGGKGKGESVTEASAMKRYLTEKGINPDRILMEDKSTDTQLNIKLSRELYIDDTASDVVIASSSFHIFRALKLANAQGLNNVQGLAAPSNKILLVNYMLREAVGITKEIVFGNFRYAVI